MRRVRRTYQRNGTTDAQPGREVWTSYGGSKQTSFRGRLQSDRTKILDGEGSRTDPCRVSTVSRLMDSGKLGYYQIGRRRVVGATHLEQYLSAAERRAKANPLHQEQ